MLHDRFSGMYAGILSVKMEKEIPVQDYEKAVAG